MRVVQLILTISPTGEIVAEHSWAGGRRQTPVTDFETIRRMLAAQLHNRHDTIGTDGAPTIAQVQHWEQHLERSVRTLAGEVVTIKNLQPDTCVWCLAHTMGLSTDEKAHRRARALLREQRRKAASPFKMGDGSVTVRKVASKDRRIRSNREDVLIVDCDDLDFSEA